MLGDIKLPGDKAFVGLVVLSFVYVIAQNYWHWIPLLACFVYWLFLKTPIASRSLSSYSSRIMELTNSPPVLSDTDSDYLLKLKSAQKDWFVRPVIAVQRIFSKYWGKSPLGFSSFNMSLLIAIFYPVTLLLLLWMNMGNGRIGTVLALPDIPAGRRIVAAICTIATPLVCYFLIKILPKFIFEKLKVTLQFQKYFGGAGLRLQDFSYFLAFVAAVLVAFLIASLGALAFLETYVFTPTLAIGFFGALTIAVAFGVFLAGNNRQTGISIILVTVVLSATTALSPSVKNSVILLCIGLLVITVFFFYDFVCFSLSKEYVGVLLGAMALLFSPLVCIALIPQVANANRLDANKAPFLLLIFFTIAPLLNAVSDWLSLAITRWFLKLYLRKPAAWSWAGYLVIDIAIALLLTGLLYESVLGTLAWMQSCGWGIDAHELRRKFLLDPWNPEVAWLTLMGFTNFIPTLLHLSAVVGVLWLGIDSKDNTFATQQQMKLANKQVLSITDAQRLVVFLTSRRWLARAVGVSVVGGACMQWGQAGLAAVIRLPVWMAS